MRAHDEKALEKLAGHYGFLPQQMDQLIRYINLLEKWAVRANLVSKNDRQNIVARHVAESLEVVDLGLLVDGGALLDLGSGAGFPGVPLAIVYPQLYVTLLDSRRVKSLFLREVVAEVPLANTKVLCERAEKVSPVVQFDFITARAVARLDNLWQWSTPLLKSSGKLVAMKGGNLDEEVAKLIAHHDVKVQMFPFLNVLNSAPSDRKSVVVSYPNLTSARR